MVATARAYQFNVCTALRSEILIFIKPSKKITFLYEIFLHVFFTLMISVFMLALLFLKGRFNENILWFQEKKYKLTMPTRVCFYPLNGRFAVLTSLHCNFFSSSKSFDWMLLKRFYLLFFHYST